MVQRVAMHVVRLMKTAGKRKTATAPAVRPEFEEIQPGTLFEVPPDVLEFLETSNAVVKTSDKRAAKFGYGTAIARQVTQEEGETAESAAARRRAAARSASTETNAPVRGKGRQGKKPDPLVG